MINLQLDETAQLLASKGNPVPAHARSGKMSFHAEKHIRFALFSSLAQKSRGTILLLQGRNETIEKYYETIADLNKRGFTVATFDWRGQGGSSRLLRNPKRGYVRCFEDHVDDLKRFIDEVVQPFCPGPIYLLAHSAGALVAIRTAPQLVGKIDRMVLCAPLLGLPGKANRTAKMRGYTRFLRMIGLGHTFAVSQKKYLASRQFADNALTSDENRFTRNKQIFSEHPQLGLYGPTIHWLSASLQTINTINRDDFLKKPCPPMLILIAGNDRIVSPQAIADYASRLPTASIITIDDARHELMQESDCYRNQFWSAFDHFINE